MKKLLLYLALLSLLLITPGCVTIFSDFQSAETLGKGNVEITPGASVVKFSEDGESEHIQTNIGTQVGVGVSDQVDMRFRLEIPSVGDNLDTFGNYFIFGAGPKVQIVENRVAGYLPVGFAFGEDIESADTFETQPTLIFTIPVSKNFEINPSSKIIIPFTDDRDAAFALNLGLGIWKDDFGIRPEIGIMKSLENSGGTFAHFGIAFSFRKMN